MRDPADKQTTGTNFRHRHSDTINQRHKKDSDNINTTSREHRLTKHIFTQHIMTRDPEAEEKPLVVNTHHETQPAEGFPT